MDQPQRQFLSEIIDCKKRGYLNAKKALATTLMASQDVKTSERLLKSARQYFCHIF